MTGINEKRGPIDPDQFDTPAASSEKHGLLVIVTELAAGVEKRQDYATREDPTRSPRHGAILVSSSMPGNARPKQMMKNKNHPVSATR